FQAEDGIRDRNVTGVQTCALPIFLQDPSGSLNPRHTVYDAVAEGLRIHGHAADERDQVATALSRAGLRPPERFLLRYPHELSGEIGRASCRERGEVGEVGVGRETA